jgi:hypothetical protein
MNMRQQGQTYMKERALQTVEPKSLINMAYSIRP